MGTWDVSPSILIQFKSTVNVVDISVRDNIIEVCFSKLSQMYFCCRHFFKNLITLDSCQHNRPKGEMREFVAQW